MKRILAVALALGVITVGASTANAQTDDRLPGFCYVFSGGGYLGGPCPEGMRPYIGAIELSGEDRAETAVTLANALTAGAFTEGSVFLARWEDLSATVMAATLSGGTWVMLPGGDGALPAEVLAELQALYADGVDTVVIVGGDGAIGVNQRVEAMRALRGWS